MLALDTFVAVSAIGGGAALAAGVDRFPTEWLRGSPFSDYVLPGLILAGVVGISAAIATLSAWLRLRIWAPASVAAGLVLTGWIVGELAFLNQNGAETSPRGPLEVLYLVVGIALVLLGGLAWRSERRPPAG